MIGDEGEGEGIAKVVVAVRVVDFVQSLVKETTVLAFLKERNVFFCWSGI